MTNKETPKISQAEFDDLAPRLRAALEAWWDDEAQGFDAPANDAATVAVWQGMPEIDSKAVAKASPVVRRYLGVELDVRLIRRGGYESFEDLADDLLSKLRATCPAATVVAA